MTSRQPAHGHRHGQAAQQGKGGDDEEAAARADQEAPSHRELPVDPVGALAPAAAEHGGGGDDHHDREGDQQDDVGGVTPTMNKEVAMASLASTPAT